MHLSIFYPEVLPHYPREILTGSIPGCATLDTNLFQNDQQNVLKVVTRQSDDITVLVRVIAHAQVKAHPQSPENFTFFFPSIIHWSG